MESHAQAVVLAAVSLAEQVSTSTRILTNFAQGGTSALLGLTVRQVRTVRRVLVEPPVLVVSLVRLVLVVQLVPVVPSFV